MRCSLSLLHDVYLVCLELVCCFCQYRWLLLQNVEDCWHCDWNVHVKFFFYPFSLPLYNCLRLTLRINRTWQDQNPSFTVCWNWKACKFETVFLRLYVLRPTHHSHSDNLWLRVLTRRKFLKSGVCVILILRQIICKLLFITLEITKCHFETRKFCSLALNMTLFATFSDHIWQHGLGFFSVKVYLFSSFQ